MAGVDATDEILRLKIPDKEKIRATLTAGYLTGNTASKLRGRVLFIEVHVFYTPAMAE